MKLIKSGDGSHSVYSEIFDESYHSMNGAVTESRHVFINAGLHFVNKEQITIFEVGFGTGLNALLTFLECQKTRQAVRYFTIELYPLDRDLVKSLNYEEYLQADLQQLSIFNKLHGCEWNCDYAISQNFMLHKIGDNMLTAKLPDGIDLVYFDAFSPQKQPELWNLNIFERLYAGMNPVSVLVTYCVKGEVRRALKSAGFNIEKLPGPPGKREMLRAVKLK